MLVILSVLLKDINIPISLRRTLRFREIRSLAIRKWQHRAL